MLAAILCGTWTVEQLQKSGRLSCPKSTKANAGHPVAGDRGHGSKSTSEANGFGGNGTGYRA
jgi:hypothetical protein